MAPIAEVLSMHLEDRRVPIEEALNCLYTNVAQETGMLSIRDLKEILRA